MRIQLVFAVSVFLALACGGTDRSGAGATLEALEVVSDDQLVPIMIQGFAESGVGGSACSKDLQGLAVVDPAQRVTLIVQAIMDCPDTCVPKSRFGELASAAPEARTQRVVEICDAAGPDPVFGGALAASRTDMEGMEYLIVRMIIEEVWSDLGKDSAEGRKLDALRPRIAGAMVAQNKANRAAAPY